MSGLLFHMKIPKQSYYYTPSQELESNLLGYQSNDMQQLGNIIISEGI